MSAKDQKSAGETYLRKKRRRTCDGHKHGSYKAELYKDIRAVKEMIIQLKAELAEAEKAISMILHCIPPPSPPTIDLTDDYEINE